MKNIFFSSLIILFYSISNASQLVVETRYSTGITSTKSNGKVITVSQGDFLPDNGTLMIKSDKGECAVDKVVAKKLGYELTTLGGLIAQDVVDVVCEVKENRIDANYIKIYFKVK